MLEANTRPHLYSSGAIDSSFSWRSVAADSYDSSAGEMGKW